MYCDHPCESGFEKIFVGNKGAGQVSHHDKTDQSVSTDQIDNIIDWQTLFTWLWRWLLLRLSKLQSPMKVLFRATLAQKITLNEQLMSRVQTIYRVIVHLTIKYWTEYLNKEVRSALHKYMQSKIQIQTETSWQLLISSTLKAVRWLQVSCMKLK